MAKILEVDAEGLNVREEPKDGDVIAQLAYGHSVEEVRKRGSWSEIRTSLENQPIEGFVANKYLIDPNKRPGFRLPTFGKPNISLGNLKKFATRASDDVLSAFDDQLEDILGEFDINKNARRLSHFLAQLSHESMGFTVVEENLNYSADGLWRVFQRHFRSRNEAEEYARQPEKIANRVYANRIGNGSEDSGDGYRYRGRGFIQLTGKDNYAEYGRLLGLDLVDNPDLAAETGNALRIAAAYWDQNGLNKLADRNDLRSITRRINGGLNGLQDRIHEFQKAASVWAAPFVGSDGKPKKDRSGVASGGAAVGGGGAATTSGVDIYESESTEAEQDIDEVVDDVVEEVTGVETAEDVIDTEDATPSDVEADGETAIDTDAEQPAADEIVDDGAPTEEAPTDEASSETDTVDAVPDEAPAEPIAPAEPTEPAEPAEDVAPEPVETPSEAEETAPDEESAPDAAPVEDAEPVDAAAEDVPVEEEAPVEDAPAETEAPAEEAAGSVVEEATETIEAAPVEDVDAEDLPPTDGEPDVEMDDAASETPPAEDDLADTPTTEVAEAVEEAGPAEEPVEEASEDFDEPVVEEAATDEGLPTAEPGVADDGVSEEPDFSAEQPEAGPGDSQASEAPPGDVTISTRAQEKITEAVEKVSTGAIEHAMDEENQLELSTFLFAALVVVCALYLIWVRIRR